MAVLAVEEMAFRLVLVDHLHPQDAMVLLKVTLETPGMVQMPKVVAVEVLLLPVLVLAMGVAERQVQLPDLA